MVSSGSSLPQEVVDLILKARDIKSKTKNFIILVVLIFIFLVIISFGVGLSIISKIHGYVHGVISADEVAASIVWNILLLAIIGSIAMLVRALLLYMLFKNVNGYMFLVDKLYSKHGDVLVSAGFYSYGGENKGSLGTAVSRAYRLLKVWIILVTVYSILSIVSVFAIYSPLKEFVLKVLSSGNPATLQSVSREALIAKIIFSSPLIALMVIVLNTLWIASLVLLFLYSRIIVNKLNVNEYGIAILAYIAYEVVNKIGNLLGLQVVAFLFAVILGIAFLYFLWSGAGAIEKQAISIRDGFTQQEQATETFDYHV